MPGSTPLFGERLKNRIAYGYPSIKRDNYTPGIAQPLRKLRHRIDAAALLPAGRGDHVASTTMSRALAYGIEAGGALKVTDRSQIDGNYKWWPSEDRSGGAATYGLQLARRPRQSANGSISYLVGHGVTLGRTVRYSGDIFDNASHPIRLAPYALVDLRGGVALGRKATLFGRIENLLDKDDETAYRYAALGGSVYAGLCGRF